MPSARFTPMHAHDLSESASCHQCMWADDTTQAMVAALLAERRCALHARRLRAWRALRLSELARIVGHGDGHGPIRWRPFEGRPRLLLLPESL